MNKHYYRFMGFSDGSGKPYGLIIKYYAEYYVDFLRSIGVIYELIGWNNYLKWNIKIFIIKTIKRA